MAGLLTAPETETGGGRPDIRSAFRQAVAQHTSGGQVEPPATTEEEDDEGEEPPVAAGDGDEDDEPEAPAPSTRATKPAAKPAVEEEDADEETEAPADDKTALTDEDEFKALQTKHANDPVALRKALNADYTRKTQALAEQRKSLERLQPFEAFIDLLQEDPTRAVQDFVKLNNLDLGTPAPAKGEPEAPVVADAVDEVLADLKEGLGPDLEYLADGLAPALTKALKRIATSVATEQVQPLKAHAQASMEKQASETTETVLKAFEKEHPDWKDHEDAMVGLMGEMQPNGVDELTYLNRLYQIVTHDTWEKNRDAEIEKAAAGRMKKRLEKMNTAERGEVTRGTPDAQVRKRPAGLPSFREAAKAALRGEQFDDEDDE